MSNLFIYKCSKCGKDVKYPHFYKNKSYGFDCFQIVAKEFIEKRDAILNGSIWNYKTHEGNIQKLNNLAKEYGVH
ncbi:MAG: hypothetical protein ACYDIA_13770 [Candidatus Humimicrobiaceae bacterium]